MFIRKGVKPPAFAEVNEARITDTYESGVIASTPFERKPKYQNYYQNHCSYCFMVANLWTNTVTGNVYLCTVRVSNIHLLKKQLMHN
jgi:hypothetical protein